MGHSIKGLGKIKIKALTIINFYSFGACMIFKFFMIVDDRCSHLTTGMIIQMINALFVSQNQKPYCTFFLTAYTQSFSGKTLNFSFTRYQKNFFHLSLRDVLIGIISSECPLLNYFLLIAKLYLWDYR